MPHPLLGASPSSGRTSGLSIEPRGLMHFPSEESELPIVDAAEYEFSLFPVGCPEVIYAFKPYTDVY